MKYAITIVSLLLVGCGEPQTATSFDSSVQRANKATTAPATSGQPAEFTAKVVGIIDGDTIDVLTVNNETIRIRLNGIDCPDRGQPFGSDAKQYLSDAVAGSMVRVVIHGEGDFDSTVGDIYADAEFDPDTGDMTSGTLVNLSLVQEGLAWHFVRSSPDRTDLAEAEQQARESDRGLWLNPHGAIAPWEWRKMTEEERDEWR